MKHLLPLAILALAPLVHAADSHEHKADGSCCSDLSKFVEKTTAHTHSHGDEGYPRVVLDETRRANLGLRTEMIRPAFIARTAFALGELHSDPRGESAAASRIAGRVVELRVGLGDPVKAGDTLALVESRQPGGEPARVPVLALADGTVDEVLTRLGDPVSPDAPLLRLADHTRLVAIARIPQAVATSLKPGATRARFKTLSGDSRELVLHSLSPHAEPDTGAVLARFPIDNRDGALSPGLRAEFRVLLSEKEFPLTVAREAVQGERGDLYIFIENAPGVYEKHPVVVGEGDESRVAITGPEAGELAVMHGALSLRYADTSDLSLKAALDAAHGHSHGPNGEEPGEPGHPGEHESAREDRTAHADHAGHDHAAPPRAPTGFFSGDSAAVFLGVVAAGEAVLLALALNALRRRNKEARDA